MVEDRKIGAIVQARMSSTRLPGKVLEPLVGQPMLFRQIERIARCQRLDDVIVATSTNAEDDAIVTACNTKGIAVARGDLDDVLDRVYQIARNQMWPVIVRLTADCPLADPDLIDAMIVRFFESDVDYLSNCAPPSYPDGLDVEIMTFTALESAWQRATLPSHREHVTPFIRDAANGFAVVNFENEGDLSHLRWTVDEPSDLAFVRAVYKHLYRHNDHFKWQDVMDLLRSQPQLAELNAGISRNEGSLKSRAADKEFQRNKVK